MSMTAKKLPALQADSSVPLYSQIREKLRAEIEQRVLEPGKQLPPESALMKRYEVSRITVRQALAQLQADGLVFKVPGKGTFVSSPNAIQEINHLEGFAEAMERQGHGTTNRVLSHTVIKCNQAVAERLGIEPGSYLMLCSDGYWKTMQHSVWEPQAVASQTSLRGLARTMVENALAQNTDDNTTVVLVGID